MSDCSGCKGCGKLARGGAVKPQAVLFANFLVFLFPIIGLFCGYFIYGLPGAVMGILLAFAIVKIYDRTHPLIPSLNKRGETERSEEG